MGCSRSIFWLRNQPIRPTPAAGDPSLQVTATSSEPVVGTDSRRPEASSPPAGTCPETGVGDATTGPGAGADASRSGDIAPGCASAPCGHAAIAIQADRKSTRLNSSHMSISYAVFCLKKKKKKKTKLINELSY